MEEKHQWPMPRCLSCDRRMFITSQSTSQNEKTGQHYVRTQYACPHCDIWQRLEIPRKIAADLVGGEKYLPPSIHEEPASIA
jgi:predicted RNA-binding Zn-ribbon protein involved in translation (DUF1610 family)